ncbi:galactose-specific lectin nattectin [Fundulus heteroclitus]|uniref:galactose-specific lectin nattectin n=1 Tax=Fundulus heteroclitus TaxID=8078 RepID=UPI00165CA767|nr:galactose-specific lectin nattectin [Fundulus heteroclitus]
MKFLSVSCFGFICLTLAHVLYLPVTGYPLTTPPGGDTSLPADYGLDWMHGTEGNNPYGFTCPEGWTMHSTQCLLFVPEKMTWEEAKKNCDSKGYDSFAAVYSDTQADEIRQEMKNAGHRDGHVWVGGSKASGDSSWSWGDYSVFDGFAKFCRGESAHHENNCLQISFDGSGSGCLDDQQCDVKLPSVCGIILY